jgi:hypothetical protein
MTDLPPRGDPPRIEDRPVPSVTRSQTGMWIVVAVLAAAVLMAALFTFNRTGSVVDQTTADQPAAEPVQVDPVTPADEPTGDEANIDEGTGTAPATDPGGTEATP